MAIWGVDPWGTSIWGSGGGSSNFIPVVIFPQFNTSNIQTIVYLQGATVDIAFVMSMVFDAFQDESITSSVWSTDNANLPVTAFVYAGAVSSARLTNNLPPGKSSTAFCSITTSLGRTLNQSVVVESELGS